MFEEKPRLILKDSMISNKVEIYQKEFFLWMLRQEIYRVERTNQPLSMILLEISSLKNMIQTYCAIPLNNLVNIMACILEEDFRKTDIKGWYNNDILAILLPNTNKSGASIAYKKLREELAKSVMQKDIKSNNHFDTAFSIHIYPDSLLNKNELCKIKGASQNPFTLCQNHFKYHNKSRIQHFLKRLIDLLGSVFGLFCLLPLILFIGLIIKLTSPGPVFFKQTRFGYHGIPFIFYKFRTMYYGVDDKSHREYVNNLIQGSNEKINLGSTQEPVLKMNNDPRVTRFGKYLRRSSLDELPQLFNVLKGEMSLVGPRPPIPYEIEKYQNWHLKRILEVKPGITGIWQVNGRSRTTFNDMVRMDLQYARNWTIGMDIVILCKTIKVVLSTKGAY